MAGQENKTQVNFKGKCYRKQQNCDIQLGSICIMCDKCSIEIDGKCSKNCKDFLNQ
jgi:hypothetical protein